MIFSRYVAIKRDFYTVGGLYRFSVSFRFIVTCTSAVRPSQRALTLMPRSTPITPTLEQARAARHLHDAATRVLDAVAASEPVAEGVAARPSPPPLQPTLAFGEHFVVTGSEDPIAIASVVAVNTDATRFVFGNGAMYHVRIRQARSAVEQKDMVDAATRLRLPRRDLRDCFVLTHEFRPPLTGLPSSTPTSTPPRPLLATPLAASDAISVCTTEVASDPDGGASSDSDESVPLVSSMSGSGDAGSELGLTRKGSAEKEQADPVTDGAGSELGFTRKRSAKKEPVDSAETRRRQRRLEERAAAKEQRITEAEGVDDGGYSMLPRGVLRASGGVIATGDERTCLPDSMSVVKCLLHRVGLTDSDSRKTVRWFSDRLRSDPLRLDTADPHIGDAKAFAAEHGIDLQHKHNWSPRLLVNADTGVFVARLLIDYLDSSGTTRTDSHFLVYDASNRHILDNLRGVGAIVVGAEDRSDNVAAMRPIKEELFPEATRIRLTAVWEAVRVN